MDLLGGKLYWPTTHQGQTYKSLNIDTECDITLVGGGMSGMLCAYYLSLEGYKVILVEKDSIAHGSSSANTGLLQYSSDIMLHKLAKQIGEEKAYLFYEMCLQAMTDFRDLPETILKASDFFTRNSLYLASDENAVLDLELEYQILKKYNFPVLFLDERDLKKDYDINAPAALLTKRDADVNPFKLIYALAKNADKDNLTIYENTKANKINYNKDFVEVVTENATIKSKYIILTTGYEGNKYEAITKGDLNRTYAIATNQLDNLPWNDKSMIWETASPYLYARLTKDNRIIAGGLDENTDSVSYDYDFILKKGKEIIKKLKKFAPDLDVDIEYAWNAVFGESKDEMPFIGQDQDEGRLFYCLGFGGNGTVYSMAGAKIIIDILGHKDNPYIDVVKIKR